MIGEHLLEHFALVAISARILLDGNVADEPVGGTPRVDAARRVLNRTELKPEERDPEVVLKESLASAGETVRAGVFSGSIGEDDHITARRLEETGLGEEDR